MDLYSCLRNCYIYSIKLTFKALICLSIVVLVACKLPATNNDDLFQRLWLSAHIHLQNGATNKPT